MAPSEERAVSRVCDNCVRKKVKCNQARPACSRCIERDEICQYSAKRRKPGPVRGAKRGDVSKRDAPSSDGPVFDESPCSREAPGWSDRDAGRQSGSNNSIVETSILTTTRRHRRPLAQLQITAEEEHFLLDHFKNTLHHAIPLFSRPEQIVGLQDRELVYTISIITAKITGFTLSLASREDLDAHLELLLSTTALQDSLDENPSLEQFRRACILSFYEFHQFPGRQAWTGVAKLVQVAYWMGLHRFDSPRPVFTDRLNIDQACSDDWRLVWWCIYRLDSYANLTTGNPYMIEEETMQVMLPQDPTPVIRDDASGLFLSSFITTPWELVPFAQLCSEATMLTHLHLITVSIMRQAGRCLRKGLLLDLARQPEIAGTSASLLDHHLSAIRLALPTNYLSTVRNVLQGETQLSHHQRLVTMLHMQAARLLVSITKSVIEPATGQAWAETWQQIVETSLDIASVSANWDSSYSVQVDPAICFILFSALIFIYLHKKSDLFVTSQLANLERRETLLQLHLELFARTWTHAQLLLLSVKSVELTLETPLSAKHIQFILTHFEAPQHPRWLQFLSTIGSSLENM